ncbi:MAG: TRAP transporter small permease [Eubacteriales bacterium]|nr:TRAP transporter small permease [Eubacteriales bacterium]
MKKLIDFLDHHLEEYLLMFALAAMACIMLIQVAARYLLQSSLSWSEEITRFLFIWSTFLSISYCIRFRISIKVGTLLEYLPPRGSALLKVIGKIVMLLFYGYLIRYAAKFLLDTIASGQISPACGIPMYLIYMAPLVGFLLAVLRLLQHFVEDCTHAIAPETKEG